MVQHVDADMAAAQLLATFSGQSSGGGPLAAAPKGFRPTGFPGRLPHASSLPRVVEETDVAVSLGAYAPPPPQPFATPPPLQRPQRTATPLTATATTPEAAAATGGVGQHAEKTIPQDFLPPPKLFQTPPQSLLPCTSGSPPISTAVSGGTLRGTLGKSQTADTSTLQAMRAYAASCGGDGQGSWVPPGGKNSPRGSCGRTAAHLGKGESLFVGPSRPRTAAARALVAGDTLHPVVRLGWGDLCQVHCNGLTGFLLGGHDRDLFIKCTADAYKNLPLVDVSQGGCIMTCSHFEKAAGRELSKKWKESIHVSGEGEGSKATLVAWLKRQAEEEFGQHVVGRPVWVCWCADAEYYQAVIVSYSRENGKHKVKYSEQFSEDLHLPVEKLDFGEIKPQITFDPANCGFSHQLGPADGIRSSINRSRSAPAATLRASASNYHAAAANAAAANAAATALYRQCSNVSTSSEYHSDDSPTLAAGQQNLHMSAPPLLRQPSLGSGGGPAVAHGLQFQSALHDQLGISTLSLAGGGWASASDRPERRPRLQAPSPLARTSPTATSPPLGPSPDWAPKASPLPVAQLRRRRSGMPAPRPPSPDGGASARAGSDGDQPAPKKRRSGLPEAKVAAPWQLLDGGGSGPLLPHAAASNGALAAGAAVLLRSQTASPAALDQQLGSFSSWLPERPGTGGAIKAAVTAMQQQVPLLPDLAAKAPPPAAGLQEGDPAAQIHWMNRVAMVLDDLLAATAPRAAAAAHSVAPNADSPSELRAARGDAPAASVSGACCGWAASPSARFQALLVHARRKGCLQGYYEAMLQRYEFFSDRPAAVVAAKMCDLVVAALHEEALRARRPGPAAGQAGRHGLRVAIADSACEPAPPQLA